MSESDRTVALNKLVLFGTAICGAPLPSTEFFSGILNKAIYDFIQIGFSNLAFEEIMLALQLNVLCQLPTDEDEMMVEFKGASFNIAYLAKILKYYSSLRWSVDRKIQNKIDGYE